MCLAIFKPADLSVPYDHLEEGFYRNPDGAGFAVTDGNKITIRKGFFDFASFLRTWKQYERLTGVVHFRWATHGKVNKSNCHPWRFGRAGEFCCVHNGILPYTSSKKLSDTGHFVCDVLDPISRTGLMLAETTIAEIEEFIGIGNKIVVLRADGQHAIANEDAGVWDSGIWYSNTGYKPVVYKPIAGYSYGIGESLRKRWALEDAADKENERMDEIAAMSDDEWKQFQMEQEEWEFEHRYAAELADDDTMTGGWPKA